MTAAVRVVAASLAAVLAVQVYALATVSDDDEDSASRAATGVATFRLAYEDPAAAVAEARDHDLFVLNADAADEAARIKAANPAAKVLVYKDLSFAADWDPDGISHGVGWTEASAHADWFATAGDQRIESSGWPGNYLLRVDNPTYQAAWRANVAETLSDPAWDGVFVDDVNWKADFAGTTPGGHSDETWRAATTSFLAAVTPALRENGHLIVLNIGAGYAAPGIWREWLAYADGAMEEHLGRFGPEAQLVNLRDAAGLGKLVLSGIGDERALAALLLTTEPGGRLAVVGAGPRWDLGDAVGSMRESKPGVFTRSFTGGTVELDAGSGEVTVTTVGDGAATSRG